MVVPPNPLVYPRIAAFWLGVCLWMAAAMGYAQSPSIDIPEDLERRLIEADTLSLALLEDYPDTTQVKVLNEMFNRYRARDPFKAYEYATLALSLSQKIGYATGEANSLNNVGVFHKNRGSYDQALNSYVEALKLLNEETDLESRAKTLSNIGNIYASTRSYARAMDYFLEADSLFQLLGDDQRRIGLLNNLGNVFIDLGLREGAKEYYMDALELYENSEDKESSFNPYTNLGQVFFLEEDLDSALYFYQLSLVLEEQFHRLDGQALALNNMAVIYRQSGDLERALSYHNQALQLAQELGDRRTLLYIYHGLVETHFQSDDILQAYYYLNLESSLKDSLYSEEASREIARLESDLQLAQKERQIEQLMQQVEIKELESRFQDNQRFALIAIALMAVALLVLMYLRYQQGRSVTQTLEHQNREITWKSKQIQEQSALLEEKNTSITDSIEYAKSVQESLINKKIESECIKEAFVFYRPKDIVSGDFYYYAQQGDYEILAVADCTGHGVAGAFMTVIGNSILNQIILENRISDPAEILKQLDAKVLKTLAQRDSAAMNHGMDIALVRMDKRKRMLTFSGAKRPLLHFTGGTSTSQIYKGSRASIGETEHEKHFTNTEIKYQTGDTFYMYSDGFADQFGGLEDRKYQRSRFRDLLGAIQPRSLDRQLEALNGEMDTWMSNHEQTDDMLVLGFRF